jgi:hypothetical protein
VLTRRGIDTGDPQAAEVALFVAAIAIGILPGAHNRFIGNPEYVIAATAKTLGTGQYFFVTGARGNSTFDSWHFRTP